MHSKSSNDKKGFVRRRRHGAGAVPLEILENRRLLTAAYAAMELTAIEQFGSHPIIAGMNNEGDLVGSANYSTTPGTPLDGFVYHDGALIPLSGPPHSDQPFSPNAINDVLEIVGAEGVQGSVQSAIATYSASPSPHWITTVLNSPGSPGNTTLAAVNDSGVIAGSYIDSQGADHGGYWDTSGTFHDIGTGAVTAINASGELVNAGNVWDGSLHSMGTLGGTFVYGSAINAAGEVVGSSTLAGDMVRHPFLYSGGTMRDLGTLGGTWGIAAGINDSGIIVGTTTTSAGDAHAFLDDGAMHDLNDLVTGVPAGWVLENAPFINNAGQIVARGQMGSNTSGWFLLNPVRQQQITGSVWLDANHDGTRDAGESGLAGVGVYLDLNRNGALDAGEPLVTTDSSGRYSFANVAPGSYTVRQVVPAGDAATAPLGYAGIVSVGSGQSVAGPDFGDVPLSAVPMDFSFLLTLAQHYNQPGTFADGDLNGDAQVNFSDLLLLAQNYGHSVQAPIGGPAVKVKPTGIWDVVPFGTARGFSS